MKQPANSHAVDTILLHRLADGRPGISIHLTVDGDRRVFTEPLTWRALARLVADGAKMVCQDLGG